MKKKRIIVIVLLSMLVLLFPIRNQLYDGGTVEYKSLLYKVSKVKKLISTDEIEGEIKVEEYHHGIIVKILGFEIYKNIE